MGNGICLFMFFIALDGSWKGMVYGSMEWARPYIFKLQKWTVEVEWKAPFSEPN